MTKSRQAALFDPPGQPTPGCPHGGTASSVQGSPHDCLQCNHEAIELFLRWYASYGRPGGKKRPGMAFDSGSPNPTQGDRASAHALLDYTQMR